MQRWAILLALTLARISMGVQFQSIAALAPQISTATGFSLAAIGALMGAYLLPGAVAALFGGWAGQKIGDIRTAQAGLVLMVIGGMAGALLPGFDVQLVARSLAGLGAVALNVMLSKMAGDWFQGRSDLPLAMGLLVSSWPAGLALAMLLLPILAQDLSLQTLRLLPAALCAVSLVLLTIVWRAPSAVTPAGGAGRLGAARLSRSEVLLVGMAGILWGFYNVAFIAAISWSADRLAAGGAEAVEAATAGSLVGWAAIISVAGGGWLARGLTRPDLAALGCFAVSGLALSFFALGADGLVGHPAFLVTLGLCLGPAAAMIMTLPVEAARPEVRALAMGIYMAIYYALMGLAPPILGAVRTATESAAAPHLSAAAIMAACICLWIGFRYVQRQAKIGASNGRS
ncbi:CynX/NimT family MFS transporter [Roseovarius aestuariivivens]|uniref:MFS transporter n=1 Tax=Roseovarius aestuariivivens TaxID=1888910 RepID=UPI0014369164|nr:MFS transporter [Roseovarius aestuariivivens]